MGNVLIRRRYGVWCMGKCIWDTWGVFLWNKAELQIFLITNEAVQYCHVPVHVSKETYDSNWVLESSLQRDISCFHIDHSLIANRLYEIGPLPRSFLKIIKFKGRMQIHILHTKFFVLYDIDFHWSTTCPLCPKFKSLRITDTLGPKYTFDIFAVWYTSLFA